MKTERQQALHSLVQDFLNARMEGKLKTQKNSEDAKGELTQKFSVRNWVTDAAKRARRLTAVTHIIKGMHPDAKGTQLFRAPADLHDGKFVGTHSLKKFKVDVAGNAADLDVYGFLSLEFDGKTLLQLLDERDPDFLSLFSDDVEAAMALANEMSAIRTDNDALRSHTLAKQIYWLVDEDPSDDTQFHLLAPLLASSLAHFIYEQIDADRFGDESKAARDARKTQSYSDRTIHEYPHLGMQKLGGSKPQNISKLNSSRKGINYLLASLPMTWSSKDLRAPFGYDSIFSALHRRKRVKELLAALKGFLESDPPENDATRTRRDRYVVELLSELQEFLGEISLVEAGWTNDKRCRLPSYERLWLDEGRADPSLAAYDKEFSDARNEQQWKEEVSRSFGRWMNSCLDGLLALGDVEFLFWRDMFDEYLLQQGERLHVESAN
jgi:CRISPR-associated protein Csy1